MGFHQYFKLMAPYQLRTRTIHWAIKIQDDKYHHPKASSVILYLGAYLGTWSLKCLIFLYIPVSQVYK